METAFRNQLASKNQSLRGNVFASSFPRNGPHVAICYDDDDLQRCCMMTCPRSLKIPREMINPCIRILTFVILVTHEVLKVII
jgi:hypothetical protein